jgi:hypothetical protein
MPTHVRYLNVMGACMFKWRNLFQKSFKEQMTYAVRTRPGVILTAAIGSFLAAVRMALWGGKLGLFGLVILSAASAFLFKNVYERIKFLVQPPLKFSQHIFRERTIFVGDDEIATVSTNPESPIIAFNEKSTQEDRGYIMAQCAFDATIEYLEKSEGLIPSLDRTLHKKVGKVNVSDEFIKGYTSGINGLIERENRPFVFQRKLVTEDDIRRIIHTTDALSLLQCQSDKSKRIDLGIS